MKIYNYYYTAITLLFLFVNYSLAQDLEIHNFIGKQPKEVIAIFGTPVHTDNTTPSMVCLFYKSPARIFVADEVSIYQAEITKDYNSESEALLELDDMIRKSIKNGFTSDSVSVDNIILNKTGIQTDIQLLNQKEKFQIRVKAKRHD